MDDRYDGFINLKRVNLMPCPHLLVQSQEWKQQKTMRILFKFIQYRHEFYIVDTVLVSLFFRFEQTWHIALVFPLLTLNKQMPAGILHLCELYVSRTCLSRYMESKVPNCDFTSSDFPYIYPLKTSENQRFSSVSRWYETTLVRKYHLLRTEAHNNKER